MSERRPDLEMYAAFDPRITLLQDLREGLWPVPSSLPERSVWPLQVGNVENDEVRYARDLLPLALSVAGLLTLIVAIAVAVLLRN